MTRRPLSPVAFCEALAPEHHLLYGPWDKSVRYQADTLADVTSRRLRAGPLYVLDASFGIGTHGSGMALHGHKVEVMLPGPASCARAATQARSIEVQVTCLVGTLPDLARNRPYDVTLFCDNSVAHLHDPTVLRAWLDGLRQCVAPGGLVIVALRDYDVLRASRPRTTEARKIADADGTRIWFQTWDWDESGDAYRLEQFLLKETPQGWATSSLITRSHAWLRRDVQAAMTDVGLVDVRCELPPESGYYLPLLTGLTPR